MNIAINMVSAVHGGGFFTYNYNILKGIRGNNDSNKYFVFINKGLFDSFFPNSKNVYIIYSRKFFTLSTLLMSLSFIIYSGIFRTSL